MKIKVSDEHTKMLEQEIRDLAEFYDMSEYEVKCKLGLINRVEDLKKYGVI